MYPDKVSYAQTVLCAFAGYRGVIDGKAGPATLAAAVAAVSGLPADWPPERVAIGAAQVILARHGFDGGPIDGRWGTQTDAAFDLWQAARTGRPYVRPHDAPAGSVLVPGRWPAESDLAEVFGPPGAPACSAGRVRVPWPMALAWDGRVEVAEIACHAEVARSLGRVLEQIADEHSAAEILTLGLHLFGGCYNPRRKRGGSAWSTHAWGVALDFDPARNRLRQDRTTARLARPDAARFWGAWAAEGWASLGIARDFDWMHVQAAGL